MSSVNLWRVNTPMTDALLRELLAGYESALALAARSVTIARALAEGHRSGLRPPDDIIEAYLARVDHDAAQLLELREKIAQFK